MEGEKMNEAEKINEISDWVKAIEAAEASCTDKDWDKESTTFCFSDGSKMVFSGPDKRIVKREAPPNLCPICKEPDLAMLVKCVPAPPEKENGTL
jgi:hypothetical protein